MKRLLLMFVLVAAGCSGKQTPDESAPTLQIKLTEDGLDPAPAPPVTKSVLEATYPGYSIGGEEESQRLAIRSGGNTVVVVDVTPDGYRAKAVDASVEGPRGISVGDGWTSVAPLTAIQCRRGQAKWAEQVYCTTADVPGVGFVFELPVDRTPGCEAGCVFESNEVLAGSKIDSIEWQASAKPPSSTASPADN